VLGYFRFAFIRLSSELKAAFRVEATLKEVNVRQQELLQDALSDLRAKGLRSTYFLKQRAPISLLYPCGERDIPRIVEVLKSVSEQTVMPNETVIAISIKENVSRLFDWESFGQYGIPNLRIYLRGGTQTAGSNRQFLIGEAASDILSFCDCDDYVVPQRTEILFNLFRKFPSVEAMIHSFASVRRGQDDHYTVDPDSVKIDNDYLDSWKPPPFDEYWNNSRIANYSSEPWVLGDPNTEPNHPGGRPHWWFPVGFKLKWKNQPHNGWLTVRASTARSVPYPLVARGQDSLYNWRLMKSHKNWTFVDLPLGVYVRPFKKQISANTTK